MMRTHVSVRLRNLDIGVKMSRKLSSDELAELKSLLNSLTDANSYNPYHNLSGTLRLERDDGVGIAWVTVVDGEFVLELD